MKELFHGWLLAVVMIAPLSGTGCKRVSSFLGSKQSALIECPPGQTLCERNSLCLVPPNCCTEADCTSPPDNCHLSADSTCKNSLCVYQRVQCPSGEGCLEGACAAIEISLTVAPLHPSYPLEEDMFMNGAVDFAAVLTNHSNHEITVSRYALGNIHVESLTRNGVAIEPGYSVIAFSEDPRARQTQALVVVPPGGTATFTIYGPKGLVFDQTDVPTVALFSPQGPGQFSVTFSYQYRGPDEGHPNVFHARVKAPPVGFQVQ
ncbi:MAG: hypothetical protein EXR72_10475 [Myxococcales bacterium]|nr:hypothetical protein [Myxococcales bacterium]